ncbi:MAG: hypothetical protein M0017_02140 [Desulfobacteraceae bacterium]|nr:hypothetical protein [Desulfobacteraceae bacterium]
MKRLLLAVLFLVAMAGAAQGEEQERKIENHGFGVFTAGEAIGTGRGAVLYLFNENCIGTYRVASGEVIVSEGKVDFRQVSTFDIPFGGRDLQVTCLGDGSLLVDFR